MDRAQYRDEMRAKLSEVEEALRSVTFRPPATKAAAEKQARRKEVVDDLERRVEAARSALASVESATDAEWPVAKSELDRLWTEISEMKEPVVP